MTEVQPTYDTAYFVAKFRALPDEAWCTEHYKDGRGRCCAIGHCGRDENATPEARALYALVLERLNESIICINDGDVPERFDQPTPRLRVIAALEQIERLERQEDRTNVVTHTTCAAAP